MNKQELRIRVWSGAAALLIWILLFSSGMLVETSTYRQVLAPDAFAKEPAAKPKMPTGDSGAAKPPSKFVAFIAATLFFTPTNVAFLALLAGWLGGCASNIVVEGMDPAHQETIPPHRIIYLKETPWAATIRSFVVYLCVIAGLYVAVDDPFKDSTSSQYLRLAGTLSLLAFLVGYDPSRFEDWIRLIPSPSPSQKVTVSDKKSGIEMTAEQNIAGGPPSTHGGAHEPAGATIVVSTISDKGKDGNGDVERLALQTPKQKGE